jgi:lipoate-protein ligase A
MIKFLREVMKMINKAKYIVSDRISPYYNLSLEEYLLENVNDETCILYLWQNQNTVVIGKNQNCWKECNIKELEKNGGYLARRLSGGGAVFHDLGNLNFTFLINKKDYDVDRQLEVILLALNNLGIKAEKSGRNDITVEGKKFSGNAFYSKGSKAYHHGTLLVDVNIDSLSRYLNVSNEKLKSKGVESVRSRVANLKEYCPDLSIELLEEKLIQAFGAVYDCKPEKLLASDVDKKTIEEYYQRYSSWDWIYGRKIEFEFQISKRFPWGNIDIQLKVDNGKVVESVVYSDAMDFELISQLPERFNGCKFSSETLAKSMDQLTLDDGVVDDNRVNAIEDIKQLIKDENF